MCAEALVNMGDRRELVKPEEGGGPQHVLVTHAVLTGLTPLIPVPLVDDLVKNYFRKRLVRSLAASAGRVLRDEELRGLASGPASGGVGGRAWGVVPRRGPSTPKRPSPAKSSPPSNGSAP